MLRTTECSCCLPFGTEVCEAVIDIRVRTRVAAARMK